MAEPGAFDPEEILRVLHAHDVRYVLIGGLAATLHGSPHVTMDVDVTPQGGSANLRRLALALEDLDARIRTPREPDGVPFERSSEMLAGVELLNLTTRAGDLDLAFVPRGTTGFADLRRGARVIAIGDTPVTVAALADVIRSKEAVGRTKDRLTLPTLRLLLARQSEP